MAGRRSRGRMGEAGLRGEHGQHEQGGTTDRQRSSLRTHAKRRPRGGVRSRTLPARARLLKGGRRNRDLRDYLRIFGLTLSVMQERASLYRVAYELAEDAAAENVRHLEVRYSPALHRRRRLSYVDIVDPVITGLADAGRVHGLST